MGANELFGFVVGVILTSLILAAWANMTGKPTAESTDEKEKKQDNLESSFVYSAAMYVELRTNLEEVEEKAKGGVLSYSETEQRTKILLIQLPRLLAEIAELSFRLGEERTQEILDEVFGLD